MGERLQECGHEDADHCIEFDPLTGSEICQTEECNLRGDLNDAAAENERLRAVNTDLLAACKRAKERLTSTRDGFTIKVIDAAIALAEKEAGQ